MAKSPKKKPTAKPKTPKERGDVNTLAFRIVQEATGQAPKTPDPDAGKDPAAVSLGRKGGQARAKAMTKKAKTASAKKAARARWNTSGK